MDNYILMNDMVQDHEARMMHLKRYYPFFRLMDTGLSQYRDGSYGRLDMSYIVLAVLRFFIEANHFQDQPVCYEDYRQFMAGLLVRDFDFTEEEADDELYQYIFDKLCNEGRPFSWDYDKYFLSFFNWIKFQFTLLDENGLVNSNRFY